MCVSEKLMNRGSRWFRNFLPRIVKGIRGKFATTGCDVGFRCGNMLDGHGHNDNYERNLGVGERSDRLNAGHGLIVGHLGIPKFVIFIFLRSEGVCSIGRI